MQRECCSFSTAQPGQARAPQPKTSPHGDSSGSRSSTPTTPSRPQTNTAAWWNTWLTTFLGQAAADHQANRDRLLVGWTTPDEIQPAAPDIELPVHACLLDCSDEVRLGRIATRTATGTWGAPAPPGQLERFLTTTLDNTQLSITEVADQLEAWIGQARLRPFDADEILSVASGRLCWALIEAAHTAGRTVYYRPIVERMRDRHGRRRGSALASVEIAPPPYSYAA